MPEGEKKERVREEAISASEERCILSPRKGKMLPVLKREKKKEMGINVTK